MRRLAAVLTAAVALGVGLTACGESDPVAGTATGQTREVTHAMGTTKVPAEPKRVVVLDTDKIDTALSLGVTPVGAATAGEARSWPTYFGEEKLAGIKEVGVLTEPDLEAINALKPDLILGSKFRQEKFYDELAAIAPTVFTEKVGITWKENFLLDGQALGKEQQAKDLLAAYEKRAKDFGAKLGDAADRTVSIVRFIPGAIRVYGPDSFSGIVVGDTGLGRPERQQLAGKEDKRFDLVSAERVNEVDADVVFVTAYGEKAAAEQATVTGGTLWKGLSAVKAGRAHVVSDETWMTGIGVGAANKIIDDLEKYVPAA
ncbi:ABC transporter substrate-binding protein [Micromonospora carbonacea]|uniref:Iron complex transport system substrate-binding protein n=1 Tax=Micromonospora carbonacea TaxID=47853 RepID=A0A1C4ZGB8_9ACTN|nr:iron-siderophore ABC transporter substrate-binding protein [Micromonospora carbonacea]MBB5827554.1 iron complex transport system substrate-binding protein [Micromonospora carbonacea]QLD24696.1 iron-siderophore ABC transporter substrate-binding protein [Micromonospora carbonacea]SCF32063.1 iron complex transport system substrate-binding protein [Micromonospora carbonacea]